MLAQAGLWTDRPLGARAEDGCVPGVGSQQSALRLHGCEEQRCFGNHGKKAFVLCYVRCVHTGGFNDCCNEPGTKSRCNTDAHGNAQQTCSSDVAGPEPRLLRLRFTWENALPIRSSFDQRTLPKMRSTRSIVCPWQLMRNASPAIFPNRGRPRHSRAGSGAA